MRPLTLFTELGLALLDGCQDHVTISSGGKTVEATSDTTDSDDVQILGSCKVEKILSDFWVVLFKYPHRAI